MKIVGLASERPAYCCWVPFALRGVLLQRLFGLADNLLALVDHFFCGVAELVFVDRNIDLVAILLELDHANGGESDRGDTQQNNVRMIASP